MYVCMYVVRPTEWRCHCLGTIRLVSRVKQLLSETAREVAGRGRGLNAVLSQNLSEGTENNRDRPRVRMFCVPVDIRTWHLRTQPESATFWSNLASIMCWFGIVFRWQALYNVEMYMYTGSCCCGDEQIKRDVDKKKKGHKNEDHRTHCPDQAWISFGQGAIEFTFIIRMQMEIWMSAFDSLEVWPRYNQFLWRFSLFFFFF